MRHVICSFDFICSIEQFSAIRYDIKLKQQTNSKLIFFYIKANIESFTGFNPKLGGSFETPWFCNYTDVSREMEKLCNLTFELRWSYNSISNVLNVDFLDTTSEQIKAKIGRTVFVAGFLYPNFDNLWYFAPNIHFNDSITFYWNDVDIENDQSWSNSSSFNLKRLASYESLVCSRVGIMIFNLKSEDKWNLVYRASSYQLAQADCPLNDLVVPEAGW